MRKHLTLVLSEHDHPVVTEDNDDEQPYATIQLSETDMITGPKWALLNWIDELHARSLLIR